MSSITYLPAVSCTVGGTTGAKLSLIPLSIPNGRVEDPAAREVGNNVRSADITVGRID